MKINAALLIYALVPVIAAVTPDKAFLQRSARLRDDVEVADLNEAASWQPQMHMPTKWSSTSKFAPSVQYLFAGIWILMLGSLPSIVPLLNKRMPTKSQMIVGGAMLIVFFGGLILFTNIILFQSVHFEQIRPLTIIECMYFMSQVITTVGYGDITPAKVRGQVFVGVYVLGAMFIISMVVSDVVNQVVVSLEQYKSNLNKDKSDGADDTSQLRRANTRKGQGLGNKKTAVVLGPIDQMLHLVPTKAPPIKDLLVSLAVFAVIDIMWVMFFSLHPDEGKTVFQAIYMSVITLSTVGFGWFTPVTEEGMIFGAYFMIFGCSALVNVITQFTELMVKLNEYEKHHVEHEREDACHVLDHVSTDKGVSEAQFLKFCLLQMKCIDEEHLEVIAEAFQQMKPVNGIADKKSIEKEILGITDEAHSGTDQASTAAS